MDVETAREQQYTYAYYTLLHVHFIAVEKQLRETPMPENWITCVIEKDILLMPVLW